MSVEGMRPERLKALRTHGPEKSTIIPSNSMPSCVQLGAIIGEHDVLSSLPSKVV
jgi:hypothetical protein